MQWFRDARNRRIKLTDERLNHLESDHPEMSGQSAGIAEVLKDPDMIVESKTDSEVEMFYRLYDKTPVTRKYLCVVVKATAAFIITAYFTDTVKKGEVLWRRK